MTNILSTVPEHQTKPSPKPRVGWGGLLIADMLTDGREKKSSLLKEIKHNLCASLDGVYYYYFCYYLYLLNTDCNFPFRHLLSMPPSFPPRPPRRQCMCAIMAPQCSARYFCFYQFRFILLCSTRIVNWKEITMPAITEYLIRNESCRKRVIYIKCIIYMHKCMHSICFIYVYI